MVLGFLFSILFIFQINFADGVVEDGAADFGCRENLGFQQANRGGDLLERTRRNRGLEFIEGRRI